MIVSEAHKYVFLQFPQAASTAIARELVKHYGGKHILRKHSNYHHFRQWAGDSADDYFTFSSIRNPLEKQVSLYYKFRSNHNGQFTNPETWRSNGGWISDRELRRFRYVQENDATFEQFFRRFFWLPFVDWSVLAHRRLDFVMRYETLQEDFSRVLQKIGLEQVRPLPWGNRSRDGARPDPLTLYPPTMAGRGCWVLGPMLEYWDYPLPETWRWSPWNRIAARMLFKVVSAGKRIYYNHGW